MKPIILAEIRKADFAPVRLSDGVHMSKISVLRPVAINVCFCKADVTDEAQSLRC